MDWVNDDPNQNTICCGHYQAPVSISNSIAGEELEITGEASQITETKTIVTGNVEATQGQRFLSGDKVTLHKDSGQVDIEGHAVLREPGLLLQGERATVQRDEETAHIENAGYVLHEQHAHGKANSIQRNADSQIILQGGTYSYCNPLNPSWELRSQQLSLNPNTGQGKGKHVRLAIADVPVLYLPYIQFPLGDQRQSGFISPSFTYGDDGLDISLPYYLNLAPNYDATIIPRYIADRGTQLGGELRHLSPLFSSAVRGAYLADDNINNEDRWLANVEQTGGRQQAWRTRVDITRVSDKDYFDDLDNAGLSVNRQTHLKQQGIASYSSPNWLFSAEALNYQTLRDNTVADPYKKLPELIAAGDYIFQNGFELNLDNRYAQFDHRDNTQTTGQRFFALYDASWNSAWQSGFFKPGISVHYLEQQLELTSTPDETHNVTVPAAYIDSGLFFQNNHGNFLHTFEPRLYHYYAAYEDQNDFQLFDTDELTFNYAQLYRNTRFSGSDRIADANQTTFGFSTALFSGDSNVDNSSTEVLRLNMGQTFYHRDREVTTISPSIMPLLPDEFQYRYTDNQSPLATELLYTLNAQWQLRGDLIWSSRHGNTESSSLYLHYQGNEKTVFSIGYRQRQQLMLLNGLYSMEAVREGDISGAWAINNRWALAARMNYDFNFNRTLEGLAGIEYNACCWRARLAYKKWAEDSDTPLALGDYESREGIYFEIELKTLGGLGTKIENILEDSIDGYGEK